MERRQKDIMTMAEHADLTVVSCEKKNSRQYAVLLAENGVKRTFSISMGSRSDARGDLNELGSMKRFARENRLPPAVGGIGNPEATAARSTQTTEPDPSPKAMTNPAKKTMSLPAKSIAPTLSPVDFYKVCEWLKEQNLANIPCMEALAMLAGQWLGSGVPEDEIKLVMETIGIKEPAHWSEPTDPQAIIARELSRVMKELGAKPSAAFERLASKLLPGHA